MKSVSTQRMTFLKFIEMVTRLVITENKEKMGAEEVGVVIQGNMKGHCEIFCILTVSMSIS